MTYADLKAICDLPKAERAAAIRQHAREIERVIAEQAMGAVAEGGQWVVCAPDDGRFQAKIGLIENDGEWHAPSDFYRPLEEPYWALRAADQMIARGWEFQPKMNGLDFGACEAYHHSLVLYVRALHWSDAPERHATALALAVALACLAQKEAMAAPQVKIEG